MSKTALILTMVLWGTGCQSLGLKAWERTGYSKTSVRQGMNICNYETKKVMVGGTSSENDGPLTRVAQKWSNRRGLFSTCMKAHGFVLKLQK